MASASITWTELELPAAELGPESPLPCFRTLQELPDLEALNSFPPDMRDRASYGRLATPLPYAMQDGYHRRLKTRPVPALRFSNEWLSAVVLPHLGGRIWSLRDDGDDLIFENPQLSFGNMALTNAWFAGGIEWNPGSTGHATTTARSLFTAEVQTERGTLLRLWEWERTRDLVFQIDLHLPADRAALFASIRIRNPDDQPKPLYWWSNIAVTEHPGVRMLAPAKRAWRSAADGVPQLVDFPKPEQTYDVSYPLTASLATDYFLDLDAGQRPWIAAVQSDGSGVVQTSTAELSGRKMFYWGSSNGGEHWQQWLCGPRDRYWEIQAGLATTQLEHRELAPQAEISWTEAYLPISGDPDRLHGVWDEARQEVEDQLDQSVSRLELDEWHAWWRYQAADLLPDRQFTSGSGAGRLELIIRDRDPDELAGTPFSDHDDATFDPLAALVYGDPVDQDEAATRMLIPPVSPRWQETFDRAASGWWGQLMIAIRAHAAGDLESAASAYARSSQLQTSAWAARGSALLAAGEGAAADALSWYEQALALAPDCLPLLLEAAEQLLALGRPLEVIRLLDAGRWTWRRQGRLLLIRVQALIAAGEYDAARNLVDDEFEVPDLREGESLDAVWQQLYPGRPLPYSWDYRLRP